MIWATRLIGLLALAASLPSSGATDLYVWDPVIEKPNSDTVWTIGKEKTITWNTEVGRPEPHEPFNNNGVVYLRHDDQTDIDHPLATNFKLTEGYVVVRVPKVKPGKNYQIVLMGDSGNWSPPFEIVA
ncbi:hypothetical protein V8E55_006203 [Tylopilus felleus]